MASVESDGDGDYAARAAKLPLYDIEMVRQFEAPLYRTIATHLTLYTFLSSR
jgi:hypothetical protein